jgi:hypothetical protein
MSECPRRPGEECVRHSEYLLGGQLNHCSCIFCNQDYTDPEISLERNRKPLTAEEKINFDKPFDELKRKMVELGIKIEIPAFRSIMPMPEIQMPTLEASLDDQISRVRSISFWPSLSRSKGRSYMDPTFLIKDPPKIESPVVKEGSHSPLCKRDVMWEEWDCHSSCQSPNKNCHYGK